jgi:hypothetical protein
VKKVFREKFNEIGLALAELKIFLQRLGSDVKEL